MADALPAEAEPAALAELIAVAAVVPAPAAGPDGAVVAVAVPAVVALAPGGAIAPAAPAGEVKAIAFAM